MDQNQTITLQAPVTSSQTSDNIQKLRDKVVKATLPTDFRQNLTDRLDRLSLLSTSSGYAGSNYFLEYEHTSSYINWVTSLPWDAKSKDLLDLNSAKAILDKNHYGLTGVKSGILEYLASIILNLQKNTDVHILRAPIICLVGLAGTGKTTLASSIAEALGRKFERIPFGGMGDAQALRGQSRAFADAEPGFVIKKLAKVGTKNPVILLDELDRVSEHARSDIMGVLIELLDPEQNRAFTDHYIDYPFDLSEVLFVATSNNTTNIATAVLDRLQVIQMPSYTDEEKNMIAKSYLFPKVRAGTGLSETQIVIDDAVWPTIIRPLGFDSGIRSLERTIEGVCRKVARLIVEAKTQSIHITGENAKEYLSGY